MQRSPATAAAAGQRRYDGATTQDIPISFLLRRGAAQPFRLKALAFGGDMLCALDDTHQQWYAQMSFGRGPALLGRRLRFDDVGAEWAVHITGIFRAQTADGTFRFSVPSLTAEEEAQVCTTGDLTWSANRRAAATVVGAALRRLWPCGSVRTVAHRIPSRLGSASRAVPRSTPRARNAA